MTILIISARGDWSAEVVADQLAARGVDCIRIDPGEFPRDARLAARLGAGWSGTFTGNGGPRLALEDVTAVYYRRPSDFTMPDGMSGPELGFARSQARVGVGGVLASLPVKWINHPGALADVEYKPRQLAAAADVGFIVPPTLITNDAAAVREFAEATGDLVVKPLADPIVAEAGDYTPVWTRRVTAADLVDLAGVETTAHLFQAWVPKAFEVRLTVVGRRLFPAAIHAGSDAARVDWRADYDSLTYETIACPAPVVASVARFQQRFGLIYGAYDFVVTPDARWVFLECNGGGQFGWLTEELDLPIPAAIADELTEAP
ncbi:ATP-grasp ribosomal peptide maturase [Longispora fulva]|uniref:ATP-grasp ribosomal peptide maturase n=1 Tax=Longispora fulva TaxID=619741 RepID=A0A8J7GWN3_9ACTN|nr:ATP-grasp ribosomal peptide maturase [Longispora fulva]MBG6140705.1 ATP-grasp ribosomal peptide maturase [Longispora fulva]GIG63695.1 ATP-grasp ribosomal peptide maturase [Longispora fulva]